MSPVEGVSGGEVTAEEINEVGVALTPQNLGQEPAERIARWVNARLRAERAAERARLTELWRGDREPASVWTLSDWEDWSNELAGLLPDVYDGDEGQEAIIERALKELLAGQIPGDGKTPDEHYQAGRAEERAAIIGGESCICPASSTLSGNGPSPQCRFPHESGVRS